MKISRSELLERWGKYKKILTDKNIDLVLISTPEHIYYLTGYEFAREQDREVFVLLGQKEKTLLVHRMYTSQVKAITPFIQLKVADKSMYEVISNQYKGKRVGIDETNLSLAEAQFFEKNKLKLFCIAKDLAPLRAVKTAAEIKLVQKVEAITQKAMEKTMSRVKPGQSEKEIAVFLEKIIEKYGADDLAFPTIVASGLCSGIPHHKTGNRIIKQNDIILIDCGAKKDGYCGDLSRTFVVGNPTKQYTQVYELVSKAQLAAFSLIKHGVKISDIDNAAREVFDKAGMIEHCWHTTGHGLGIGIHEYPSLHHASEGILRKGMVITVEPGLYFDWGGVRIEDVVAVTESGYEKISSF